MNQNFVINQILRLRVNLFETKFGLTYLNKILLDLTKILLDLTKSLLDLTKSLIDLTKTLLDLMKSLLDLTKILESVKVWLNQSKFDLINQSLI